VEVEAPRVPGGPLPWLESSATFARGSTAPNVREAGERETYRRTQARQHIGPLMIRVSVPVLLLLVSGATAGLGPSLVPGAPLLAHLDLGRGAHISPVPTHKTALLGWGKNEGAVIVAPPVFTPDPEQWFNATPGLNASRSLVGLAGNPPPLLGPAMAQGPGVDGAEFVNVLFGGTDPATGTYSDQTWVYVGVPNGSAPSYWTNVTRAPNAPPAVANASLDYDAGIGQFVLFGGIQANGELSGQTWFLNERTWKWSNETAVTCAQYGCPNSRESASMGYASDLLDLYTFVFGGCENAGCTRCFNDTWYLEPEGGGVFGWIRATTPSAPSPRYSAPLAFAGNDSASGPMKPRTSPGTVPRPPLGDLGRR